MSITKTKGQKIATPKGYIVFPHFKEPFSFNPGKDESKYSCLFFMKKEDKEAIEKIKNVISVEWKEAGLKSGSHNPLKDGDEKANKRQEEGKDGSLYNGYYYIKASSKFPIKIIDGQKQDYVIDDDNNINGKYGRLSVVFKAYENGVNKGVTAYLRGAQIISDGIDVGSNVKDDFEIESEDDLPF